MATVALAAVVLHGSDDALATRETQASAGVAGPAAPTPDASTPAGTAPPESEPPVSVDPTVSVEPTASPEPEVVDPGTGRLRLVDGGSERSGSGPLRRYRVQVEGGLGVDVAEFAGAVDRTLADSRSWGADDRLSFQRVDDASADFTVVLASPTTADRLCRPLDTAGIYSCGIGSTAVINSMRWLEGADAYDGHLPEYRQYVVNHEVGHVLGHHHDQCAGKGRDAPVMMQQTKGVGSCTAQPWPYG